MSVPRHARRQGRRALLGGVLLLTLAAGCTGGATGSPTTHAPSPPAPSATTTLPTPVVVQRWVMSHAGEPLAAAYQGATLWVTFSGAPTPAGATTAAAGQLVKVDTRTGQMSPGPAIGGSPSAIAATADRVWVADTVGDGNAQVAKANTVLEFDTNGDLLHTYAVSGPTSIAAVGTAAWVEYSAGATGAIRRLHDGVQDAATALPARTVSAPHALAACSDGLYAATADADRHMTNIRRMGQDAAPRADITFPAAAVTLSLACGQHHPLAFAVFPDSAGLYRVPDAGSAGQGQTLPYNTGLVLPGHAGTAWLIGAQPTHPDNADVEVLPADGTLPGAPLTVPGVVTAADADPDTGTLYTVASSQPQQVVITALRDR